MNIYGVFEVCIITKPEFQMELFGFIADLNDKELIHPRPMCAYSLYGDHPNQPMLTFMINGRFTEVQDKVEKIVKDMINSGVAVMRIKIKSMAYNIGVPLVCSDNHYFEYYFKVTNVSTTQMWNKIVELITRFGAHLFHNPYNKNLIPIVTIRRYTSLSDLQATYLKVKELLEEYNYSCEDPEKEYSVIDNNISLDKGWIYKDEPDSFITKVQPQMIF